MKQRDTVQLLHDLIVLWKGTTHAVRYICLCIHILLYAHFLQHMPTAQPLFYGTELLKFLLHAFGIIIFV